MTVRNILMAAGGSTSPTFVSSSINNSATSTNIVPTPINIQDGDLLIALTYTVATANVTPPSGFSQIYAEQTANPFMTVNVKTAESESGNYTFTTSVSTDFTVAVLVYRNANKVNTQGDVNRTSTASATALSITPTLQGTLLAAFSRNTTGIINSTPSGFTSRVGPGNGAPFVRVYDKDQQGSFTTGDHSLVYLSASTHSGVLLQITNEPDVAPEFVASATTQNTVTGGNLTINKPLGTIEGDLMLAVIHAGGTGSGTWSVESGWAEIADIGVNPNQCVAYKVAGASEDSNYTFTCTETGNRTSGTILTYRYAAYDTVGSFTSGTDPLILPSIIPSGSQSLLIAAGTRNAASITLGTPTNMNARVTNNDATTPSFIVCDQTVSKGPTGSRSMITGSTTGVSGLMFSIKPTRSLT